MGAVVQSIISLTKSLIKGVLAHLNHFKVSYYHQPLSVMRRPSFFACRQQCALNYIFSGSTRPKALIFGMKHCLVNLYQAGSNGGPGVQNGPAPWGPTFEAWKYTENYSKVFFRTT